MANIVGSAIDSGQNFLQGKATSVLSQVGDATIGKVMDKAEAVQNLAMSTVSELQGSVMTTVVTMGSAAGSIVGDLYGTSLAALGDLTQCTDLAAMCIENITTYSIQLVTERLSGLVTNIPSEVTSAVGTYTVSALGKYGKEVLQTFIKDADSRNASKQNEDILETISKYVTIATDTVSEINEKVNSFIGGLQEDIKQLTEFIAAGPQFIAEKIDEIENGYKEKIGGFINKQADNLNNEKMKFINSAAEKLANKIVDTTVQSSKKLLQIQYDAIQKNLDKIKQQANTQIQKLKLELGAKLGIGVI